ncbi:hypothetical protein [Segnochrobactrum spirostomi]|uniref:Uncharacterized protein n=1 Tax=Segnochrobactrum spirostomi TaxID=2608987 RepID=A0A6A7Y705_9HYPH|nr:hypothetical protein [Segnochrobactrum spirostomi]MQT13442.1 hypothetical protein [Segnochrobactrum spirostomi]
MDVHEAEKDILNIFSKYGAAWSKHKTPLPSTLTRGKLYELYVLGIVLQELHNRGCNITFKGRSLLFKAAPGKLKLSDPHFVVETPNGDTLWLFVDIEFNTLGQELSRATDRSRRHELDIVLVDEINDYPSYRDVWFGAECKAHSNFRKSIIKEVLGVRRELSGRDRKCQKYSRLTQSGTSPQVSVYASPPPSSG